MGKNYCKIHKIDDIEVEISATYETNRYYQTEIVLYDIDLQLCRDISKKVSFTVYAKTDTKYMTAFDCIIMRTEFKDLDNVGNARNRKVCITASEVTYGNRYFDKDDRIHELFFKVTDGTELLGLIPYEIIDDKIEYNKNIVIELQFPQLYANLDNENYCFSVFPNRLYTYNNMQFEFMHNITYSNTQGIVWGEIRDKIKKITSLLEILCGEIVTSIDVRAKCNDDEFECIGLCNHPKLQLHHLQGNGIDSIGFLRKSIFKISDFKDLSEVISKWLNLYSKIDLSLKAYQLLLLDEDVKISTSGKFLKAMQLVEGYMTGLVFTEDYEQKSFETEKIRLMESLTDEAQKLFVNKYCIFVGQVFLKSLKHFTYEGINIINPISKSKFFGDHDKLLKKIRDERDIYTHASNRDLPKMNIIELLRISECYKSLYRICILNRLGMDKDIIKTRFGLDNYFSAYIEKLFDYNIKTHCFDTGEFDKKMWPFSETPR